MQKVITAKNINKSFKVGSEIVHVLKDVSIELESSNISIIIGPAGCGKSTLLHILLGLEKPDEGEVLINGNDIYSYEEGAMNRFRRKNIGMVYQHPNWVRSISVLENVALPYIINGQDVLQARVKAKELIDSIGMVEFLNYSPVDLSSGQQQKIAFVRSLMNDPSIIIADEPTGNLDKDSGMELINLLIAQKKMGKTILMVTHNLDYSKYADKLIEMVDGRIKT
jgi:putative ABC transport system ATP-binding protein